MKRLIVVCEGGIHTINYLNNNGLYPGALLVEFSKFQEVAPYLTKDDDILILIAGMTDFTMASLYGLVNRIKQLENKYNRLVLMSNIPLGKIGLPYYLYKKDLFRGSVKYVDIKQKKHFVDSYGRVIEEKKSLFKKNTVQPEKGFNPIMREMKKEFGNKKTKLMIYGKLAITEPVKTNDKAYSEKVIDVDIYKKKVEE